MEKVFLDVLNNALTASYIIAAVILFRLIFKKIPKYIRCLLWGLVALRLVMPFSIESSLSIIPSSEPIKAEILETDVIVLEETEELPEVQITPILPEASEHHGTSQLPAAIPEKEISEPPVQISSPVAPTYTESAVNEGELTPPAPEPESYSVGFIAGIVWITVAVMLIIWAAVSYIRLKWILKESVCTSERVYVSDRCMSPFVMGFFSPKIYLPSNIDESCIPYVLAHERAHIKRGDHIFKVFAYLIMAFYWFNPLVIISYFLYSGDIELACDEKVIQTMSESDKKSYSSALLSCSARGYFISACPVAFGEVGVKLRIMSVLGYKKTSLWLVSLALAAAVVMAMTLLTDPKPLHTPKSDEITDKLYEMSESDISDNNRISEPPAEEPTPEAPVEEPTPEAPVEELTPEPPVEELTPELPVEEPTPEAPVEEPTPEPPVEEPTPEPPAEEPTPEAPVEEPTPEPPVEEPTPETPVEELTPETPVEEPTPEAPVEELTPEAPVEEPTPEAPVEESNPKLPEYRPNILDDPKIVMTAPASCNAEEIYTPVMLNRQPFRLQTEDGEKEVYLYSFEHPYSLYNFDVKRGTHRILDTDGDGVEEIAITWTYTEGLVLRYSDGIVKGYPLYPSTVDDRLAGIGLAGNNMRENGIFSWKADGKSGVAKLSFDGEGYVIEQLAETDGKNYFVNGEKVTGSAYSRATVLTTPLSKGVSLDKSVFRQGQYYETSMTAIPQSPVNARYNYTSPREVDAEDFVWGDYRPVFTDGKKGYKLLGGEASDGIENSFCLTSAPLLQGGKDHELNLSCDVVDGNYLHDGVGTLSAYRTDFFALYSGGKRTVYSPFAAVDHSRNIRLHVTQVLEGRYFVITTLCREGEANAYIELYATHLYDTVTGKYKFLADKARHPVMSPDMKYLAYCLDDSLCVLDIASGNTLTVKNSEGGRFVNWIKMG